MNTPMAIEGYVAAGRDRRGTDRATRLAGAARPDAWEPAGTSPMRRCSWRATRRASSAGSVSPWTAANRPGSAEPAGFSVRRGQRFAGPDVERRMYDDLEVVMRHDARTVRIVGSGRTGPKAGGSGLASCSAPRRCCRGAAGRAAAALRAPRAGGSTDTGQVTIGMRDAAGDFVSYAVDVTSLRCSAPTATSSIRCR